MELRMMSKENKEKKKVRIILYCAGAANVGRMTLEVAHRLARDGAGRMSCLAGIGAQMESFINSARNAQETLVLDGCPTACGRKIMEDSGIAVTHHFIMTEYGVQKSFKTDPRPEESEAIVQVIRSELPGMYAHVLPMAVPDEIVR